MHLMGKLIRELARRKPELADGSGRGFWPIPAQFPLLLAKLLYELQVAISAAYLHGDSDADLLSWVRVEWMKLVHEGDLGENHTALFLADHPNVVLDARNIPQPFSRFCESALMIENPFILLGFLSRNEEGSLDEARALVETGLVREGVFARIHLVEEVEHARIAAVIRERVLASPFADDFRQGEALHDELYRTILN